MRRIVLLSLFGFAALSLAAASHADEVIALKSGAYFKVRSHETREDRLIITDLQGQILVMRLADVDLERSKLLSEASAKKDADDAARKAQEEAEADKRAARAKKKPLSLVEASRRYGVDRPAMNIAESGPAEANANATPAEPAIPAIPAEPATTPPVAAVSAEAKAVNVAAAKTDLDGLKKRRDELAKKLDEAKSDGNINPLAASQRQSRIEQLQADLAQQDGRIAEAQKKLQAAQRGAD